MGASHASWFGSAEAPLFGHIHLPDDGRARAAVVLCPPLGKEHLDTYRGMKALAEQLTDRSFMAVRFDYAGTGDSAGEQDAPDAVAAWRHSIVTAVSLARTSGAEHITLVGLRAGALLASAALPECGPIDAVVLWDPILSGRALVREQRALYSVTQGTDDPADPRVSIIGGVLASEAAAALRALTIDGQQLASIRTLVATRPAARDTPAVTALVTACADDELTLDGHESFTTPTALRAAVPFEHIDHIADWIERGAPAPVREMLLPIRRRAAVATTGSGLPVYETTESLGPDSLFCIRTHGVDPSGIPLTAGPTVLFFGTAYEHRIGPARLWVELARDLAEHGISSVRFDRDGVGDTGTVSGSTPIPLYSDSSDRDADDAAAAACADPRDLVAIGLCSGAWYSSHVAIRRRARGVVLVNMILWSTYRRKSLRTMLSPPVPAAPGGEPAAVPTAVPLRARIKPLARQYLPYPLWRLLGRLGVTQVPEVVLEALRRAGVSTTVALSAQDFRSFRYQRGEEGLQRLRRRGFTGRIRAGTVGDHGAYQRDGREFLRAAVTSAVLAEFDVRLADPMESEHAS